MCGISKGTFEIPHKISHPYIERYNFYATLIIVHYLKKKYVELPNIESHYQIFFTGTRSTMIFALLIHV